MKMTDKEILELTTLEFIDDKGEDIRIPLGDIEVLNGDTIKVDNNTFKVSKDHIEKILVKKGRLELSKVGIDSNAISTFIEDKIEEGIEQRLSNMMTTINDGVATITTTMNNTLQSLSSDMTTSLNDITVALDNTRSINGDYELNIEQNKETLQMIDKTFSSLKNKTEKVMLELKVLIED